MPNDRLDGLIRTFLAVGGGALAVSLLLFLGSDSLELDAGLVGALQLSWLLLFYVLAATAGLQLLALLGPPAGARRLLKRLLLATAFAALVLGLAALAYVSVAALAGANADKPPDDAQHTHLVLLPNASGA
jgi:hypothetical protein